MKKFVLFLSVIFFCSSLHAQVFLVEDLQAIACNIENGITMYQNLVNSINQYTAMMQEIEQAAKNFATHDFSSYFDYSDFDPSDTNKWLDGSNVASLWHGSWDGGVGLLNSYQNDVDYMNSLVQKKRFQIGNMKFSLDDIFSPDRVKLWEDAKSMFTNPNDPDFKRKEAEFYMKHGMSYNHYQRMYVYSQICADAAEQLAGSGLATEAAQLERVKELETLSKLMSEEDPGEAQRLQAASMAAYSSAVAAHDMAVQLTKLNQLMGYKFNFDIEHDAEELAMLEDVSRIGSGDYKVSPKGYMETGSEDSYTGPGKSDYRYDESLKINIFDGEKKTLSPAAEQGEREGGL